MTAENRAHRILRQLKRYAATENSASSNDIDEHELGSLIGIYHNPELKEQVQIRQNGLSWMYQKQPHWINFQNIASIRLEDKKNSDGLVIVNSSGEELFLPIRGRDGKLRDSLEMLRYLDRVISDEALRDT